MSGITVPNEARVKYLTRRQAEIDKIKASLMGDPDWDLINKVGHQIKGNAITFGFPELSEGAKSLEDAAKNKDIKQAIQCLEQLERQVRLLSRAP